MYAEKRCLRTIKREKKKRKPRVQSCIALYGVHGKMSACCKSSGITCNSFAPFDARGLAIATMKFSFCFQATHSSSQDAKSANHDFPWDISAQLIQARDLGLLSISQDISQGRGDAPSTCWASYISNWLLSPMFVNVIFIELDLAMKP